MAISVGTNYYVKTGNVYVSMTDQDGNADTVRCSTANIPSGVAGYAIGCTLKSTTSGTIYSNIGTTSSCNFVKVGTQT